MHTPTKNRCSGMCLEVCLSANELWQMETARALCAGCACMDSMHQQPCTTPGSSRSFDDVVLESFGVEVIIGLKL